MDIQVGLFHPLISPKVSQEFLLGVRGNQITAPSSSSDRRTGPRRFFGGARLQSTSGVSGHLVRGFRVRKTWVGVGVDVLGLVDGG